MFNAFIVTRWKSNLQHILLIQLLISLDSFTDLPNWQQKIHPKSSKKGKKKGTKKPSEASKSPLKRRQIMSHLESISRTIHQAQVEDNRICTESQKGDSVDLLSELTIFLSKPLSWPQAVIK